MPSDEMPDAAFTHTVRGYFGEELTIGAYRPEGDGDGGAVQFVIKDEQGETVSAHISSPAEREAFARALMEAYRIADGEQTAAESPGEAMCAVPAECGNGPGPHPFTPVAGDPLPRPCCRQPQEMTVVPAVLAADDCGCGLGPERCMAAEDGDSRGC